MCYDVYRGEVKEFCLKCMKETVHKVINEHWFKAKCIVCGTMRPVIGGKL